MNTYSKTAYSQLIVHNHFVSIFASWVAEGLRMLAARRIECVFRNEVQLLSKVLPLNSVFPYPMPLDRIVTILHNPHICSSCDEKKALPGRFYRVFPRYFANGLFLTRPPKCPRPGHIGCRCGSWNPKVLVEPRKNG